MSVVDLFESRNSVKWSCPVKGVNQTDLEYAFGRYGRIVAVKVHGKSGVVEFETPEDAAAARETEIVILGARLEVVPAELDPNSVEFKSKSQTWLSHLVETQERRYVFTDVAWAMYGMIPAGLRPRFWVDFNQESYISDRGVIEHYMVTFTVKKIDRWLHKKMLKCPVYKSLCRRVEGALNGFSTFSVSRIYGSKESKLVVNRPARGCNLFYNGQPFYFHHDVELLQAISSIIEQLEDGTRMEARFAKFAEFVLVDYHKELQSVINDVYYDFKIHGSPPTMSQITE